MKSAVQSSSKVITFMLFSQKNRCWRLADGSEKNKKISGVMMSLGAPSRLWSHPCACSQRPSAALFIRHTSFLLLIKDFKTLTLFVRQSSGVFSLPSYIVREFTQKSPLALFGHVLLPFWYLPHSIAGDWQNCVWTYLDQLWTNSSIEIKRLLKSKCRYQIFSFTSFYFHSYTIRPQQGLLWVIPFLTFCHTKNTNMNWSWLLSVGKNSAPPTHPPTHLHTHCSIFNLL